MRRRAFRPEVPGRLEDRSLLSGVAGLPGGPVVLSIPQLNQQIEHMQSSFAYFSRYREIPHLLNELHDDAEMIPFSRADGLDESIDDIVERIKIAPIDAIEIERHDHGRQNRWPDLRWRLKRQRMQRRQPLPRRGAQVLQHGS